MDPTPQPPLRADEVRERVERVFKFLAEVARRRSPVTLRWQEHPWKLAFSELPDHPDVVRSEQAPDGHTTVLRIRRPDETPCPAPPPTLTDWILPGWTDVNQEARHLPSRNIELNGDSSKNRNGPDALFSRTTTVAFDDDSTRVAAYEAWNRQREAWREAERPVRRVSAVYQRLFELQSRIARESERLALNVGDGLLRAEGSGRAPVEYPLLVQRCELIFDPKTPAFEIRETADPPELSTPLLRELSVDGRTLLNLRAKLAKLNVDILDTDAGDFLAEAAHALFPNCEILRERPTRTYEHAVVFRDPVVFAAHRTGGMVTAIEGFLQRLHQTDEIPGPLRDIIVSEPVATDQAPDRDEEGDDVPQKVISGIAHLDAAGPPLLTKPANPEQEMVVTTLERDGAVVVQGPPGTGKTHTIANLLGHLLAKGMSVLVTSHTTKALRVLRDKVAEEIRPLCVSVLDRDAESRQQLEESVKGIIQGLATTKEEHSRHAELANAARQRLWTKLKQVEQDLRKAIRDQYDDIVLGGKAVAPAAAARLVRTEASSHAWLPGPLEPGHLCPLSGDEVRDLYATNAQLSTADEADLAEALPPVVLLPTPDEFVSDLRDLAAAQQESTGYDAKYWKTPTSDTAVLTDLAVRVQDASASIRTADKLTLECMNAGRLGGSRREPWDDLLETFDRVGRSIDNATALIIRFAPTISPKWTISKQRKVCSEILAHLTKGHRIGWMRLAFKPSWRRFLASCTVRQAMPSTLDDLRAINAQFEATALRDELRRRWQLQIEPLFPLPAAGLGDRPEDTCRQIAAHIRQSLDWNERSWNSLEAEITTAGLDWASLFATVPPRSEHCGDLLRIADACEQRLLPALALCCAHVEAQNLNEKFKHLETLLAASGTGRLTRALTYAVRNRSPVTYKNVWLQLDEVYGRVSAKTRRDELLARLRPVAPVWADAIANRLLPHDVSAPPGDAQRAWYIRQLQLELERREGLDPDQLQDQCHALGDQLQQHTRQYVKHRAWARQHDRTDRRVQAALKGWLQTVSRRGYHSGVMSARLKEEARKLLNQARGAVPVWIMPLSRVVEAYDFRVAQFDVVILDEASQCDMTGLVALGLAKQAVVVGDDKQVSPVAVGEDLQQIQTLIDEYLQGVSNAHLYTGRLSVYDMATFGFGKTIRLKEHFRCVPNIIQFSNQLSYDGEIKPLREFASVATRPFTVSHRVADGCRQGKINEPEALEIASLIVAACQQPEYEGMTFGVISMVGEEQAVLIDSMLQRRLPEAEYARRSLLCGIPPQFQGDERDVVFLAFVDGGGDGPLRSNANNDDLKKRFNVAASRARNQMWIVHSLNPATDLQPADFRYRLIAHALDPKAADRQLASATERAESELERRVIRHLSEAGYRIAPQWRVGAFRIDIVVIGANDKRAAIECDGDRFHPPDKLDEDLARQLILERLGWRFIRIRGTSFFRDPEQTMQHVIQRMADLEVQPIGAASAPTSPEPVESDLLIRVKRRAEEIRRNWIAEEEQSEAGDFDDQADDPQLPGDGAKGPSAPSRDSHAKDTTVSMPSLTDADHAILACLREASRPLSRRQIIERIGIDATTWNFAIRKLAHQRLVSMQGNRRAARYSPADM